MNNIDQEFIEFVVKSLVGKPEAVSIERRIDEKGVLLELTVDPEDLGRVIGKRGATAQSLRTLLRALGTKNDARYNLKIIDNGVPHEHTPRDDKPVASSSAQDDQVSDEPATNGEAAAPAPQPETTPEAIKEIPPQEAEQEPEQADSLGNADDEATSERLKQARKELDDLDDLDI